MYYLNDQVASQTTPVPFDPDPDQMVAKIQTGLNSLFGTTGATPNFKAFLLSTKADGSADKIEISAANTGLYAGVNIDALSFKTLDEVQTITLSGISSSTSGRWWGGKVKLGSACGFLWRVARGARWRTR